MKIHNLSRAEVLETLLTSERGISETEAGKRLHEYGRNEIKEVRKKPLYLRFIAQLTHFLALLLWIASGLCFISEYMHPGEGMLSLGIAILGVIFINAVFTFIQEYRAEKALEALKKMLPFNVKALRDGFLRVVPAKEVVPGDVILLNEGDKVPADSRVIDSSRLMVNNAPLTGESDAKMRAGDPSDTEYLESPNIVFAGTMVASGSGKAVVFSTGMSTEFGKIAHLTSAIDPGLSPLQKEIVKVTRIVAVIAVTTGVAFFGIGSLMGRGFWQNFLFAVGILIANVPEGLLPTVTLSLAMGSQRMARKKALIKTLSSVETLGAVTVICTDKTGTLTQNRMEVQSVWTVDGLESSMNYLMTVAYLCNNAVCEEGRYKGDPTETAIFKAARKILGDIRSERISEIPFDSDRKRMTTLNLTDGELSVFTKGALETVMPLCGNVVAGEGILPLNDDIRANVMVFYNSMMDKGLRVIAFAYKKMERESGAQIQEKKNVPEGDLESGLTFIGLMGLEDPPRPEVPDALRKCDEAGIKTIMITGDASRTALAIGRQIGLVKENPRVIEGAELNGMSDSSLSAALESGEIIFARMTPSHKMRIVSVLKDEGERVAVTGDGVNDAPALKKADIGIAMGISGTDVAKEAADMVLLDDNFATIVNAIEEGRGVFENLRKFITYIFASNIPELVPYLAYVLLNIPLPLTIMQILAIDLGTDIFPALALGAEKPAKDAMKQPPRSPDVRLLNFKVLGRAYLFLGPVEAIAGLYGFFYVLGTGGWQWGQMLAADNMLYMQATTACLGAIIASQVGNAFTCRSAKESIFKLGFFSNRLLLLGIAAEIIITAFIIYNPLGNRFFGTEPLGAAVLLSLAPFCIVVLAADELRKFYLRRLQAEDWS